MSFFSFSFFDWPTPIFRDKKKIRKGRIFFYFYFPDRPTGPNWLVKNPPSRESTDHGLRLQKILLQSSIISEQSLTLIDIQFPGPSSNQQEGSSHQTIVTLIDILLSGPSSNQQEGSTHQTIVTLIDILLSGPSSNQQEGSTHQTIVTLIDILLSGPHLINKKGPPTRLL